MPAKETLEKEMPEETLAKETSKMAYAIEASE